MDGGKSDNEQQGNQEQPANKEKKLFGRFKKDSQENENPESSKNEQPGLTVEKLSLKKNMAVKFGIAAAVVAVIAIVVSIYIYRADYNKRITVIVPIGDLTFTEKTRDENHYYVTFQAADYNRIPAAVNEKGARVGVEKEIYDILALEVEYDSADVIFEVPQGVARKAGYSAESMNYQTLWTDDILQKYTTIKSIVWSAQ